MANGIQPGSPIVLVLHTPKEKYWGVLDEISSAGVFLRGLDLNAFDDWVAAILHKEPFIGLTTLFFPLWRVGACWAMKPLAVWLHFTIRSNGERESRLANYWELRDRR